MKLQTILVASLIVLGSSSAFADPLRPIFGGSMLPPPEINAIVRSMGFVPTSRPVRQGLTYAVLANDHRGRPVRVIVDARFGDVLSVRRARAEWPPGAYPVPPRVYGVLPRARAPYEMPWMGSDFRPPGLIGRADPYQADPPMPRPRPAPASENPQQKSAAAPASPNPAVVTIGPSAAARAADPKPTGSTARGPSFPPMQSLE